MTRAPVVEGMPDEVSALVSTLKHAEARLWEITGGQVDAIAGADGRTFVLQSAQDAVRRDDALRCKAIFNCLPATIALLDHDSFIVAVNDSWHRFGASNGHRDSSADVGSSYLDVCRQAHGEHSEGATWIADGLASVLSGRSATFSAEYACHSPEQQRWFDMTVSPLGADLHDGVVVMHTEVTARKALELAAAERSLITDRRERLLSTTLASVVDFAQMYDRRGRFLFANQPLLDLWGLTLEQVVGRNFHELDYPEALAQRLQEQIEQVYGDGRTITDETEFTGADGRPGFYEYIFSPVLGPEGVVEAVVGTTRDITERKRSEAALRVSVSEQHESARLLIIERSLLLEAQRLAKIGSWTTYLPAMAVIWSEETHRIFETELANGPRSHESFLQLVHPLDRTRIDKEFTESLQSHDAQMSEHRVLLAGNRVKYIEARWQVQFDAQGLAESVVGTSQDISERRLSELRIQRLNRGVLVLSQINALIVRVESREELFREACRIAVVAGQFPVAWIGVVDAVGQKVVLKASTGADSEFLERLGERLSLAAEVPFGRTPTALAVREKRVVVINDVATHLDDCTAKAHIGSGIGSLVKLPLIVAGEVVAVLGLESGEVDYFDEAEQELLEELAGDIAFAIDHIGKAEKLAYIAYYDSLTGLANRALFSDRAGQCLRSAGTLGHGAALVLVDLERFKGLNDSLGKIAGDELLRKVGAWLADNLPDSSLLGRVSADIFAFMLVDYPQPGDAARKLAKIIQAFHEEPFELESGVFRIAGKFGVAMYPDDETDSDSLFQKAESALKSAKAGGDRYLFYTQKMTESVARRLGVENQLRHALDNEEFVLHYQPKIELRTGLLSGAEALIRWNDPRTGLVPPLQFVPILEETGLINDVGRWAIAQALRDNMRWRNAGFQAPRIAVNVSPWQLRDAAFVGDMGRLLAAHRFSAQCLELEITESMIMVDINQSIATLQQLRDMSVRVAVDDFGTGFSSLGYLSKLPVDSLKIDRTFVKDMTESPEGLSLVSTIIFLAHSLQLKVVAEGVETEEQRRLLQLLRCDEMQGYLCSPPVPAAQFEARFLIAQ